MSDTTAAQDEEIEALQAIYMDDFELSSSESAWHTRTLQRSFRIVIHPIEEDLRGRVRILLHFKFPLNYPNVRPLFTIENPVGVSEATLKILSSKLTQTCKENLGSVMVHDLCSEAATIITDRFFDAQKAASLERERELRAKDEKQRHAQREILDSRKQEELRAQKALQFRRTIEEEMERQQETELALSEGEVDEAEDDDWLADGRSTDGNSILWPPPQSTSKTGFSNFNHMRTRQASSSLSMIHLAWDRTEPILEGVEIPGTLVEGGAQSQVRVLVYDFIGEYFRSTNGRKKIARILDSVQATQQSPAHEYIESILGFYCWDYVHGWKGQRREGSSLGLEGLTLAFVIASPFSTYSSSSTLASFVDSVGSLRLDRAFSVWNQVAQGLARLHASKITHGSVDGHHVLIKTDASSKIHVVLRGAGYMYKIYDLIRSERASSSTRVSMPDLWKAPESLSNAFHYDRNRDLWDLGILYSETLFGVDVTRQFASPANLLSQIGSSGMLLGVGIGPPQAAVRDILSGLFTHNPKGRCSAQAILSILESVSWKGASHASLALPSKPDPSASANSPLDSRETSRYRSEFEELEFLGRGAGGQVVKVRNLLDGHLYAIKKIRLPEHPAAVAKLLREVTIWSRMNHPNIVRYHASWIENDFDVEAADAAREAEDSELYHWRRAQARLAKGEQPEKDDLDLDLLSANFSHSLSIRFGDDASTHSDSESGSSDDDSNASNDDFDANALDKDKPWIDHEQDSLQHERQLSPSPEKFNSSQPLPRRQTLYIQMEYLEKLTLREAIDDGLTEDEAWKFLTQILSGIMHFSSLDIIHRDLKPSNIFIDAHGNVRIGDFGLAINKPEDLRGGSASHAADPDMTSDIGTSLYIAPEMLSSQSKHSQSTSKPSVSKTNKVDMYSLGIIVFEMWQPLRTGHERIQLIRNLRKPDIVFPDSWNKLKLPRQTEIIKHCLTHDPNQRFSPAELLSSNLLPSRFDDTGVVDEAIRVLARPSSTHYKPLVAALFAQGSQEERLKQDFIFDGLTKDSDLSNDPHMHLVMNVMFKLFTRLGALRMQNPLLLPRTNIFHHRNNVAELLDSSGTIVTLPYDLTISLCRMVSRDISLNRLKRFTCENVFRKSSIGGQPRALPSINFALATEAETLTCEVECILVADRVLSIANGGLPIVHWIGHGGLWHSIVGSEIPQDKLHIAADIFVKHYRVKSSWTKTASELMKSTGCSKAFTDTLKLWDIQTNDMDALRARTGFTSTRESPDRESSIIDDSLTNTLDDEAWSGQGDFEIARDSPDIRIRRALSVLENVLELCRSLGLTNVKILPLLSIDFDWHPDGIIFTSALDYQKACDVIAIGGRFDSVVHEFAGPAAAPERLPHVIGVSFSASKLALRFGELDALTSDAYTKNRIASKRTFGPYSLRRCDAYLVSFTLGLTSVRLELCNELWKSDIRADLTYDDTIKRVPPAKLAAALRREGVLYMVIVKSVKQVVVKSLLNGSEDRVPIEDVALFLKKVIREHNLSRIGDTDATSSEQAQTDEQDALSSSNYVILPETKKSQPKVNRIAKNSFKENAVQVDNAHLITAPTIVISADSHVLLQLANPAWLTDDSVFRQLDISPKYASSIRKKISDLDVPSVWLHSSKVNKSVLLQCRLA